jgi:3-oxoacyl-[acyl-carrier-protein] synthase-3
MGTIIKATGVSIDNSINSSITHAYNAAEDCIANAGIDRNEIDIIINTGIFRDFNLFEPSVAILIQKRLGISSGYSAKKHTLSFDLMNGACGVLYASQAVDTIFQNSDMRKALIISSDTHPSNRKVDEFPYSHLGAAMLLEWDENKDKGFTDFQFRTGGAGFSGVESYMDTQAHGPRGRESLSVHVDDDYSDRLISFTVESIVKYLESAGLKEADLNAIKLLTTQPTQNFNKTVTEALGIMDHPADDIYEKYGDAHSSSLNIAYHEANSNGLIKENDRIIFSASSAGLTAGTVLYNN